MLISTNSRKKGDEMPDYLRLEAFRTTPLVKQPFEHLIVSGFIGPAALAAINADYPAISSPGSFPVDQVSFGPAFQKLLDELESDQFREAFEEKFGIDLTGRPTVTTVRGRCDLSDGKIHTDSKSKIITVLIYMNETWEQAGGGCACCARPPISTTSSSKCRRSPARSWHPSAATIPGTVTNRFPASAASFNSTG